jgi:hypothetical protein
MTNSNTIGNRTRDLMACSAELQPLRAPIQVSADTKIRRKICCYLNCKVWVTTRSFEHFRSTVFERRGINLNPGTGCRE